MQVFKFVVHGRVKAWEEAGWVREDSLEGCHHGYHAALMRWPHDGEPVFP
jgi:hypothetical protein